MPNVKPNTIDDLNPNAITPLKPVVKPVVTPAPETEIGRYQDIVKRASSAAEDYQKNLPSLQAQNTGLLQNQARHELAKQYVNADRSANARGMFYGGKRAGLRGQAESSVAGNLADSIRAGNLGLINQGQAMGDTAIEGGIGLRDSIQELNNQAYNEALSKRSQGSFMGSLGGLAGTAVGGYLGGSSGMFLPGL